MKEVKVLGRRHIVCRNAKEARKDVETRANYSTACNATEGGRQIDLGEAIG